MSDAAPVASDIFVCRDEPLPAPQRVHFFMNWNAVWAASPVKPFQSDPVH
jgi:hypothetical protein